MSNVASIYSKLLVVKITPPLVTFLCPSSKASRFNLDLASIYYFRSSTRSRSVRLQPYGSNHESCLGTVTKGVVVLEKFKLTQMDLQLLL